MGIGLYRGFIGFGVKISGISGVEGLVFSAWSLGFEVYCC